MRGQNMPRPADFVDAHRRHWDDAELLFDHARWASADQMYGFSAECGLKAVMKALGMPVDDDTGAPKKRRHWKHVQDLWPVFRTFAQGHGGAGIQAGFRRTTRSVTGRTTTAMRIAGIGRKRAWSGIATRPEES